MEEEQEDHELQRLRHERMKEMLEAQQRKKQQAEIQQGPTTTAEKIDMLFKVLAQPDALQYLSQIKAKNVELYNKIRMRLFPPQILQEIDLLLMYLAQGRIRRGVISLVDVQRIEREVLGIKNQITVKRRDQDAKSLTSYLKEDLD